MYFIGNIAAAFYASLGDNDSSGSTSYARDMPSCSRTLSLTQSRFHRRAHDLFKQARQRHG